MTTADAAHFYKLGFLMACADRGLGGAEAERLAERVLTKQAGPIGWAARRVAQIPSYLLGAVGATGAAAGAGLGKVVPAAVGPSGGADDAAVARMKAMTAEIKRRKARLSAVPTLFS